MGPRAADELRRALLDRFETDRRLGLTTLPIRLPAPRGSPPAAVVRGTATPFQPTQPLGPEAFEDRRRQLDVIDGEVKPCRKCGLAEARTNTVFGVGSPAAKILFVGEAPGRDEDARGEPFVGRAGRLLTDMITKGMGLKREDVYICNILKCRPPDNRDPAPDEIAACRDYLWRQIEIIKPEVIIALGAPASKTLLGTRDGIGRLRGQFHDFYPSGTSLVGDPIPLMATYHPAYLLRSPGEKNKAWSDLKMVMARLGIPLPSHS